MRDSKQKRQIRKLVQMLISRYNVSAVYVEDIVKCLECSQDVVEEELGLYGSRGSWSPFLSYTVASAMVSSPPMNLLVTW
jgi:hypothetical protein